MQCLPPHHDGTSDPRREHPLSLLSSVNHLVYETNAAGSTGMENMEKYFRFYSRPSSKGKEINFSFRNILSDHIQVYTNLFPARHTWYLLATVVIFNGIDWAGFEVLSIGNKEIEGLPTAYRIMDGLFQALGTKKPSTRACAVLMSFHSCPSWRILSRHHFRLASRVTGLIW